MNSYNLASTKTGEEAVLHVFTTELEQGAGVLPFQLHDGSLPRAIFVFPFIRYHGLSGIGLAQPVRVYALDANFALIKMLAFHSVFILSPREFMHLPKRVIHLVETAHTFPVINNFSFLNGKDLAWNTP